MSAFHRDYCLSTLRYQNSHTFGPNTSGFVCYAVVCKKLMVSIIVYRSLCQHVRSLMKARVMALTFRLNPVARVGFNHHAKHFDNSSSSCGPEALMSFSTKNGIFCVKYYSLLLWVCLKEMEWILECPFRYLETNYDKPCWSWNITIEKYTCNMTILARWLSLFTPDFFTLNIYPVTYALRSK
jgi:hypothetical protein